MYTREGGGREGGGTSGQTKKTGGEKMVKKSLEPRKRSERGYIVLAAAVSLRGLEEGIIEKKNHY